MAGNTGVQRIHRYRYYNLQLFVYLYICMPISRSVFDFTEGYFIYLVNIVCMTS